MHGLYTYIYIYTYVFGYLCVCLCSYTHKNSQLPNHKKVFQGDDGAFDDRIKAVNKKVELIGFHLIGNQAAKKRFEAMLA